MVAEARGGTYYVRFSFQTIFTHTAALQCEIGPTIPVTQMIFLQPSLVDFAREVHPMGAIQRNLYICQNYGS